MSRAAPEAVHAAADPQGRLVLRWTRAPARTALLVGALGMTLSVFVLALPLVSALVFAALSPDPTVAPVPWEGILDKRRPPDLLLIATERALTSVRAAVQALRGSTGS